MTSLNRIALGALVTLTFGAGLAGCDHPPSNVSVEVKEPDPEATPPTVSLPEPPSASDFIIEEKNDDGTLRVQGLIEYKAKHMDKEVVVTGRIVRLSPDCDPGKAKKKGEKCPEPHMVIRDDEEDAEKHMLIVGYKSDLIKRAKLKEGEVHKFKGTYQMMGYGFTASEDGLLVLAEVDDEPISD